MAPDIDQFSGAMHPAEPDPVDEPPGPAGRKRVYIVDDDPMVRRSLFFALSTTGFEVRSFMSGRDFLDEADALAAGCVLLDLRMPKTDGIAVLDELGARVRRLPVVIITGHGEVEVAVKAMKRGATDFLEKPFTDAALLETLNALFLTLPAQEEADAEHAQAVALIARLTPRERDVLQGLVAGLSNKGIARQLNVSARTVEVHRANLMDKLEAGSFAEVLRMAMLAGLTRT